MNLIGKLQPVIIITAALLGLLLGALTKRMGFMWKS
mgnify:CR=1 FL=1